MITLRESQDLAGTISNLRGLFIRRGWMGVEPTAARSARPADGFEDRGSHRATTTPEEQTRRV
jgi:hypothetical protein